MLINYIRRRRSRLETVGTYATAQQPWQCRFSFHIPNGFTLDQPMDYAHLIGPIQKVF